MGETVWRRFKQVGQIIQLEEWERCDFVIVLINIRKDSGIQIGPTLLFVQTHKLVTKCQFFKMYDDDNDNNNDKNNNNTKL